MTTSPMEYFFPEVNAGGYSRVNSSLDFYLRINSLLNPDMVVLDFGAGRGCASEEADDFVSKVRAIKGKVKSFIGADVDPQVLENPLVDQAFIIKPDEPLSLADESVDIVISDWVFEHIENTDFVISELRRILKPGGWICARTPNRWGYIAIGATLIPEKLHETILRLVQPKRKEIDVFPKFYKLNSMGTIQKQFRKHGFASFIYAVNSEPAYAGNSKLIWWAFLILFRLTPSRMNAILHVFSRKSRSDLLGPTIVSGLVGFSERQESFDRRPRKIPTSTCPGP